MQPLWAYGLQLSQKQSTRRGPNDEYQTTNRKRRMLYTLSGEPARNAGGKIKEMGNCQIRVFVWQPRTGRAVWHSAHESSTCQAADVHVYAVTVVQSTEAVGSTASCSTNHDSANLFNFSASTLKSSYMRLWILQRHIGINRDSASLFSFSLKSNYMRLGTTASCSTNHDSTSLFSFST